MNVKITALMRIGKRMRCSTPRVSLLYNFLISAAIMAMPSLALNAKAEMVDEGLPLKESRLVGKVLNEQEKKVSGIVRNSFGEPMAGVSVKVLGTNAGTTTDSEGKYEPPNTNTGTVKTFKSVGV